MRRDPGAELERPLPPGAGVAGRPRPVLPRAVSFWVVAYLFAVTMLGTTLPTPLYVIYQGQWHFSAGTITVVFSTYAAGVLAALLLAGRSSDQVGRKPVLATALGLSALSTVVFILAPGLGWLFVGRLLSGFSAGLVTGTATACLTDLVPPSAPPRRASVVATVTNLGGLGLGPLVAGLLAEYAGHPTVLVFELYLGLLTVAAAAVVFVPEPVVDRQPLSLRLQSLGIPHRRRAEFGAAALAGFVAFSLMGLFTALAPSFLGNVLHEHNHALGGLVVFVVFATGAVTQVAVSALPDRAVVLSGLGLLLAALALIVAGLSEASLSLFIVAAVVSGVASGAAFASSLATANQLAPPDRRGEVISTYFVFSYVGLTIPVVSVGIASQHVGDFRATLGCAIALAVLALGSIAVIRRSGSGAGD